MHPLLAAGDTESKVSFWDLQLLEESGLGENIVRMGRKKKRINNKVSAPRGLAAAIADKRISRAASHPSESSVTTDPSDPAHSETSKETESSMDDDLGAAAEIGDPFKSISPHKIVRVPAVTGIPKKGFSIRGTAWSQNGEWFVACGDYGMIGVMTRWGSGRPE
jgi:polycomb protein EED